jgi:hypothetical protein
MKTKTSIERLKDIITDENCKKMNLSNVKGYLGELIVLEKLLKEKVTVEQKGNQSGYDIEIIDLGIKIDVKLSTIKTEVKNCPPYWGWAIKHENKKRDLTATHFVCVALNVDFSVKDFYVIKAKDYKHFPKSAIGQFGKVKNGFTILSDKKTIESIADKKLKEYFNKCSALVDNGIAIKLGSSKPLTKYLLTD